MRARRSTVFDAPDSKGAAGQVSRPWPTPKASPGLSPR